LEQKAATSMTELNLGGDSFSANHAVKPKRKLPRPARVAIAGLLSLFLPGMGQLYARKIWRGVVFAVCTVAIDALSVKFRLFLMFPGGLAALGVALILHLYAVVDAVYLAWKYNEADPPPTNDKAAIAAVLVIFLLVGYPVPEYSRNRMLKVFRAYKISSGSMCPTLCEGERVVVAADAYKSHSPERGDLIVFDFDHTGTIFPKRVTGIAGDVVSPGPENSILVNGVPPRVPAPCGSQYFGASPAGLPSFKTVKIPAGNLFVVGDNLGNSYDSRFFGPIPLDEVRGQLKFIYWSSNRARIGCRLR
jgi:signal peptidase I